MTSPLPRFLRWWRGPLAAAFLLAVAAPRAALAADPVEPSPRLVVGKVHFHPPVAEWTLVNGSAAAEPTIVGGSVTLEIYELVVAEAGADLIFNIDFSGPSNDIFVRAGVAPILAEGDYGSASEGWALQLDALFGYRYLYRQDQGHETRSATEKTHGLAGAVGLETTFWFSRAFGLNLRLLGGMTFAVDHTWTGHWAETLKPYQYVDPDFRELRFDYSVDFGFDIGVAF